MSYVQSGKERENFSSLSSQILTLPFLVAGVIKGEVHREVRPKGPAPFPDVLGVGWGDRRNMDMWKAGPGMACVCVIKGTGWGGQGVEGEFFALLRV